MGLSLVGRFFHNFERIICYNLRLFIGKHEKTFQILFLVIYVILQLILIYCYPKTTVILLVVLFLFFLSLERIFVHIWLDYERGNYKKEGDKLRFHYNKLKRLSYREIRKLERILKKER